MPQTIEVPSQVRELVTTGIDNVETALTLLFDDLAKTISPNSSASIALLKRAIDVKIDYARKVALARDLSEATALHFVYCRAQIEITTDLIRLVSEPTN